MLCALCVSHVFPPPLFFCLSDYLFLDEPTNHLDLEAVLWLQDFLIECDLTLVIVSHDRNFLNQVCTDMLHFHHGVIDQYKGDFDTFENSAREANRRQKKAHDAQQKKRAHMQAFVDKFRYNAKRAAMAQSRIKALKRMELLDDVVMDPTFRFEFPDPEQLQTPILAVNDMKFKYEGTSRWIFKKANFGLDLNSRIGLGKSVCAVWCWEVVLVVCWCVGFVLFVVSHISFLSSCAR